LAGRRSTDVASGGKRGALSFRGGSVITVTSDGRDARGQVFSDDGEEHEGFVLLCDMDSGCPVESLT
jgi:hypothetical protein